MLELDLIGRKISLSNGDTRLLLAWAEEASGSSIGSRDLATRLREFGQLASDARPRLVLTRAESRVLQRTIEAHLEPGDQLRALRLALEDLLTARQPERGQ